MITQTIHKAVLTTALIGGLALAGPAASFEATGNAAADHYLKIVEAGGAKVSVAGPVSEDGSAIVIGNLTATLARNGESTTLTVGETRLETAEILGNGRLSLAALSMKAIAAEAADGGVNIETLRTTDTVLPSPDEVAAAGTANAVSPLYRTAELTGIVVEAKDSGKIPVERIYASIDALDGDLPTAGSLEITGITLSKDDLDEEGRKGLTDLGYDQVVLSVTGTGKWLPDDGILTVEKFSISGNEVGDLTFAARINGLTREVMEQLDKSQGDPEKALGLLQGLGIEHVSVDLENKSVVDRVLDKQASEAGTDRATFVSQLTGALPLLLSVLDNPEFQNKVTGALTTFLNNPKSLKAVAAPANPVPVAQLIGTVMIAPQTLPDVLGIDILANEQ